MSEKLCLKWNDFQDNTITSFGSLRNDRDFADITLVCEDGQQVEAHKVILAASSPFFHTMLRRNKHPHPMIYMRGVTSEDLGAIVDFLYFGEANVYQEKIDAFMAIAEELNLKGLTGNGNDVKVKTEEEEVHKGNTNKEPTKQKIMKHRKNVNPENIFGCTSNRNEISERTVATTNCALSADQQELDDQIKSLMSKSGNFIKEGKHMIKATICTLCGKEGKLSQIKDHIETNHVEGVSFPCNICEKICRSRKRMADHKRTNHTNC